MASAWTVIAHVASPTSNLITFSGLSLGSYQRIMLLFDGLVVGTDGAAPIMQLSTGGSFHTANYRWAVALRSSSASSNDASSDSDSAIQIGAPTTWGVGNAANENLCGRAEISNLGAALFKQVEYNAAQVSPSGANVRITGGGQLEQTAALDGVRIGVTSGTLTAGMATLYGLRTS